MTGIWHEVALWVAHQRALETAEALQSDLQEAGTVSEGEDQRLVAKVEVGLELALEACPELTLETGPVTHSRGSV